MSDPRPRIFSWLFTRGLFVAAAAYATDEFYLTPTNKILQEKNKLPDDKGGFYYGEYIPADAATNRELTAEELVKMPATTGYLLSDKKTVLVNVIEVGGTVRPSIDKGARVRRDTGMTVEQYEKHRLEQCKIAESRYGELEENGFFRTARNAAKKAGVNPQALGLPPERTPPPGFDWNQLLNTLEKIAPWMLTPIGAVLALASGGEAGMLAIGGGIAALGLGYQHISNYFRYGDGGTSTTHEPPKETVMSPDRAPGMGKTLVKNDAPAPADKLAFKPETQVTMIGNLPLFEDVKPGHRYDAGVLQKQDSLSAGKSIG